MKKIILVLAMLPCVSFGYAKQVTSYSTASCTLSKGEQVLQQENDIKLMTLSIEDHLGRFTQVVWNDGETLIQYQFLIEDDESSKTLDAFLVLQNLKVGEKEISSEFAAKDVNSVSISDGTYKVSCALPHE
ncbi:hypothetical protein [Bdellovibrio svalbardensis]|uniref:Uncharacterized protein n=1 Tax=Bdellovibrio svalbardensis TaxID=2972972 RepID=A0ABT6DSA6_9BACT|nr:hypothetical protein [Bdellovibrio svalbardensis]MDG0818043.1 hypothetical protein [Bdellovibrio svalbardensis]